MAQKFKTLPIERMIVIDLQSKFNNPKIKVDDLMEWNTREKTVFDNLRSDEVLLQSCGVTLEQLKDYEWDIETYPLAPHKFHCIGVHPVAARIDIIKDNIVIH